MSKNQQKKQKLFYQEYSNQTVTIIAQVTDNTFIDHQQFPYRVDMSIECIKRDRFWHHEQGTIQIYMRNSSPVMVGDRIIINHLTLTQQPAASYGNYLIKEGILATSFTNKLHYRLLERPSWSIERSIAHIKQLLLSKTSAHLTPAAHALYCSIFLGNKQYTRTALHETQDPFNRWGLAHYFARSGLHLALIAGILFTCMKLLPIPLLIKLLISASFIVLYALVTWSSISFIRALASFILIAFCCLSRKSYNYFHILSLVTTGVLLCNPMQLLFLDFQLSFGLTAALVWATNALSSYK